MSAVAVLRPAPWRRQYKTALPDFLGPSQRFELLKNDPLFLQAVLQDIYLHRCTLGCLRRKYLVPKRELGEWVKQEILRLAADDVIQKRRKAVEPPI